VQAERLLVAVGRRPDTDGLDFAAAGVETDRRGFVRTDPHLGTTAKTVYAVGDVTGGLQFTHAADEMGRIAAANALGRVQWRAYRPDATPWVTFTDPEVGRVGITEEQAAGHGGQVAFLPMSEVDRAITAGRTDGFVKLIAGPRPLLRGAGGGRLLGASIVAERGGDMVAEAAQAIRTRMFAGRLAQTTHAYPSWALAVQQAAAQFFFEIGGRKARPARPAGR
jgi:pyruvate/2-oxoglutarate dehydrogenase complex dihydrolipoamide dehydrogenase (E3) component